MKAIGWRWLLLTLFWGLLMGISPVMAVSTGSAEEIPAPLLPWKAWVLSGQEALTCPPAYNGDGPRRCIWSSRLDLRLEAGSMDFQQDWLVLTRHWVALPGDDQSWPADVIVNGQMWPVIHRKGRPEVLLEPGEHRIRGRFHWHQTPDTIRVPADTGIVSLVAMGQKVTAPHLDEEGRLWLKRSPSAAAPEDRHSVTIFRLLTDSIPFQVTQHVQLTVSGNSREIVLENILLENALPMSLESPLPARLTPDGNLIVQARPGQWQIACRSRLDGPVARLANPHAPADGEIWSFEARNHLRMVTLSGAPAVEPVQTEMPAAWRSYPAYLIDPETTLTLTPVRRGDPDPAPDDLHLKRTWWLDFDGQGLTVQDEISGTIKRSWSLAVNPPAALGRVAVDGQDRLITAQGQKAGVALRRGALTLTADLRYPQRQTTMPAVGWDHDFQSLSASMHLPPGWRLFAAGGVDEVPQTWLRQWTLLDLFLVLIIAIAVLKLYGFKWGCLALVTTVLIYQEVGAPRLVWLHILATAALLRYLPQGWFRGLTRVWRYVALVVLIVVALPFMVGQARWGIYPHLEPGQPWYDFNLATRMTAPSMRLEAPAVKKELSVKGRMAATLADAKGGGIAPKSLAPGQRAIFAEDPDALIQTGPGLPNWQWRSVQLRWNGPVDRDQKIHLWLVSPRVNSLLAFARVLCLAALILVLLEIGALKERLSLPGRRGLVGVVFIALCLMGPRASTAQEATDHFPSPLLLQELQERLLKPPACLPTCADIRRMEITADAKRLQLLLEVHAAAETVVPLPVSRTSWQPDGVLLDQLPLAGLARDGQGALWGLIPQGVHTVAIVGATADRDEIQFPLPLAPQRVSFSGHGWQAQGIREDGRVDTSVTLIRQRPASGGPIMDDDRRTGRQVPPFFQVQRTLHLGIQWQVATEVSRLTPPGTPVALSLPLIAGEAVNTQGIFSENGQALLQFGPQEPSIRFVSVIEPRETILLSAPANVPWSETWVLDASPIWQVDLTGIAVVHHQDREGNYRPAWRPWPGEEVNLAISRPAAVAGRQLTIDAARLDLTPARRSGTARLTLDIRSSRGSQHSVEIPPEANLLSVAVAQKSLPIRQDGRLVMIPLNPGPQKVVIEWHQRGLGNLIIKSPRINIGEQAVNVDVRLHFPHNRWILFTGGPGIGPAVLYWSYCFVLILVAVGLGRITITPLATRHWLLLGLGLTQVHPLAAVMIVGWLLALGYRGRIAMPQGWLRFNAMQLLLAAWTLAALVGLYTAVETGLLGLPDMQIAGNNSTAFDLNWTLDRIQSRMPRPYAVVLPMWGFHVIMLLWSLWLAFALIHWLKWGWNSFGEGGLWKKSGISWRRKQGPAADIPPTAVDEAAGGAPRSPSSHDGDEAAQ